MTCPVCTHANPDGARFCNECGAALGAPAPRARHMLDYTPRHLAERVLQSRSAIEGERKRVTVLFADLEGSLELARHFDPEAWHRILDGFFGILSDGVHRFEGTVNQYTGDGVMALFGAPLAHEDHAQRACHASLAIIRGLSEFAEVFRARHGRDFPVRIGLNAGEVVVGKIGDDLRMDYTAQGHVVGVAARVQQVARAGEVWVTAHVEHLVRGYFRLRPLGARELAGAGAPVELFALEGEGPAQTRLDLAREGGFSPFVGRDEAMATLEKALARARAGSGLVVGVEGDAGIGKSRLCVEFMERCRDGGVAIFEAHCPSYGRGAPHLATRALLRSLLGLDPELDDSAARERIGQALTGAGEDTAIAALWDFLGVAEPDAAVAPLTREERVRLLARVAAALIRARARRGPTVLLVDDLHWIDPDSEALLGALVEEAEELGALLLLNNRPDYRVDWMEGPHFRQLGLRPLERQSSDELIRVLLGSDAANHPLAERIRESAAGNPFFIEELVRSLVESGRLAGARGAYEWRATGDLPTPETVSQVLAARIDRLEEADKRLLQVASVIGRRFAVPLLARVEARPDAALAASLARLEAAEFVRRESLSRPGDYAFAHSLTQEVAYQSLLVERRRALHRSVARAVEQEAALLGERAGLIAHHWEGADEPGEARRWRLRAALGVTNLVPRRRWEPRSDDETSH